MQPKNHCQQLGALKQNILQLLITVNQIGIDLLRKVVATNPTQHIQAHNTNNIQ
jgi:hypothetical protein